jgi:hypothetical protein
MWNITYDDERTQSSSWHLAKIAMESQAKIVGSFVDEFSKVLRACPIVNSSFYDSFEFTRTGNNYSHPRTVGLLVKVFYSLPEIVAVDSMST